MKRLDRVLAAAVASILVVLGTLIVGVAVGSVDATVAELAMTAVLVIASITYAAIALVSVRAARETSVRPVVALDLQPFGGRLDGAAMRIMNCGSGPALDVRINFNLEPDDPRFSLANLAAVRDGLVVLPNGEQRLYSTGQKYDDLAATDERFEAVVSYTSLSGTKYSDHFTLKAQNDRHLLRTSIVGLR